MDPICSTIALFLISIFIIILVIKLLIFNTNPKKKKKTTPPSPISFPILGHLHLLKNPLYFTLKQLAARHGPIMLLRFGSRRVLVVSSLSIAAECFSKLDIIFANRPKLHTEGFLTYNHTTLGTAPYGAHWRNIRRIVAIHLSSSSRLNSSSPVRANETRALLRRLLRETGLESRRVELKSVLHEMVMNVMMRLVAGKRYYGDGVDVDEEEARWFEKMVKETFSLSGISNKRDFLPALLRQVDVHGVEKVVARLKKAWDEYLQRLINEIKTNKNSRKETLIGTLLAMQEEDDPSYYSDRLIKAQVLSILSAGTDTPSATLEWGMSLLLNHPEALKRVRDEIDGQVGNARLMQEKDMPMLSYLHCIVLETLRLYPAASLLLPHESSEDCTIAGFDVSCGTILLVNAYAMHRDPGLWEDAFEFRPERFLGGDEKVKLMLPFGMGRRRCPGEGLSFRLVELVLGSLVQCFEWERVGNEEVDMEGGAGLIMRKAVPLEAMCKPRQALINVLSQL